MRNGTQKGNDGGRTNAAAMGGWWQGIGLVWLVLAVAIVSPAEDEQPSASTVRFKVLVNIDATGFGGNSGLAQGTDGNLYGTLQSNVCGLFCGGTVYRMTPAGTPNDDLQLLLSTKLRRW